MSLKIQPVQKSEYAPVDKGSHVADSIFNSRLGITRINVGGKNKNITKITIYLGNFVMN